MKKCTDCALLCALLLTGCGSSSVTESPADSAAVQTADTTVQPVDSTAQPAGTAAQTTDTTVQTTDSAADTTAAQTTEQTDAFELSAFRNALPDIRTVIEDDRIGETGTVNGVSYTLTIDLSKWAHHTTPKQILELSRLFWQCYPRMYARFHALSDPPTDVILAIEDEGYAIAEAGGNFVHLHDMWLHDNPTDYDCITHELAHLIQGAGWDENYMEYSYFTELFADCCRYEYAMDDGAYNDPQWELQTIETEFSRSTSVRFFVWLDYWYSTPEIDMIARFFEMCHDESFAKEDWDTAWGYIFEGTPLEHMNADEVWNLYASSDFARLNAVSENGNQSILLHYYDIREKLAENRERS